MDPSKLIQAIRDDLSALDTWYEEDELLVQERMCYRSNANPPYPGAPNYKEPIIDDTVREKTDQEISMYYNASRMCFVAPLADIPPAERVAIEAGFDSYLRYIIKPRARLEEGMDCKNARGFAVFKQTRRYNKVLKREVSDFITCDIRDVIVPPETTEVELAERICHVLRKTPRQFKSWAKKHGVSDVDIEDVLKTAATDAQSKKQDEQKSSNEINRDIAGITTSESTKQIIIWEVWCYNDEAVLSTDEASGETTVLIPEDTRCVKLLCPDLPNRILAQNPWLEDNGNPRSWPFVRAPFENRSSLWYDCRGGAHLCLDDQLEATGMRNARDMMIDFNARPLFRNESGENTSNVTFHPGSTMPKGITRDQSPQIPNTFDFVTNQNKISSGKRMSAGSVSSYSSGMAENRKLQKSATEVNFARQHDQKMSSTAVERFSDPVADIFQMVYEDMARMQLAFPVIIPGQNAVMFNPAAYQYPVVWVSGATSRTLDPDVQVGASMQMVGWLAQFKDMVPMDLQKMITTVLSYYDSRLTAGWVPDQEAQMPINMVLTQLQQMIQTLAQGGKQLDGRVENVEKLVQTINQEISA